MPKTFHCPVCGVEVTHDRHKFIDDSSGAAGAPSKITQQYCDDHCPRCAPTEEG